VACKVAAWAGAGWIEGGSGAGASVVAAGFAAGSMAVAIGSVVALCEAGVAAEPEDGADADSAGGVIGVITTGVTSASVALPDRAAPVASGSTLSVPAAGATGAVLAWPPGAAVLMAADDSAVGAAAKAVGAAGKAVGAAGKALGALGSCFAGTWSAFWLKGYVPEVALFSSGCASCATRSSLPGWGSTDGAVAGAESAMWTGFVSLACLAAVSLLALFFSVGAGDDPAFERAASA
jgi:hypothetical protein